LGHQLRVKYRHLDLPQEACPFPNQDGWYYEPLRKWRDYAEQVSSILKLADECRKEHPNADTLRDKAIWENASREWLIDNIGGDVSSGDGPIASGRAKLAEIVSHFLRVNDVRPVFEWSKDSVGIRLRSLALGNYFLLPILAVQLMLAVNNSGDMTLCSGCSEPFLLRRGQSLYRNSYCEDCVKKRVSQRKAVSTYNRKERTSPHRKKRVALTKSQVGAIKRTLKQGERGATEALAKKYGVSKWTIYKIGEGKNWANVK
jgi:hypothetical protein